MLFSSRFNEFPEERQKAGLIAAYEELLQKIRCRTVFMRAKTETGGDGDYTVTYGANIVSGKNKGSVTITGSSVKYGGSVTVKFEIKKRDIYHVSYNIP